MTEPGRAASVPADAARGRLDECADRVAAFWGVQMPVVVGEVAATDWNVVQMPSDWAEMPDATVLGLLLHEWGHRTLAPVGIVQALWWELLAKLAGIGDSHEAVNLATDLLIDRFYASHPLWGGSYREFLGREHERFLERARMAEHDGGDPLSDLLGGCYQDLLARVATADGLAHGLDHELARTANDVLLDDRRPLDDCMRGFFEAVAPVFRARRSKISPLQHGGQRRSKGSGRGPVVALVGRPAAWRSATWDARELVRLLVSAGVAVPDPVLDEVCGARAAEVRARLRVAWSLARVERTVARLERRLTGERQENSTLWRVGDTLRTLDPILTFERSARLIPGVTTLRRTRTSQQRDTAGLGALCLIVDNSGSTSGPVMETILDAAVGLLEAARRLRVPASLIVFGTGVVAAVPIGRDYDHIATLLASLESQSGGTRAAPALELALRDAARVRGRVATVVFTDSYIFDVREAIPPLAALVARGPTVLFCVESRLDSELMEAVGALTAAKPRVVRHCPGDRLVDVALEVFDYDVALRRTL